MIEIVATFPTIQEAYIAKGMLENNGIKSVINNEDFNSIYPLGFTSFGSIKLLVDQNDVERAKKLLAEHGDEGE